MRINHTRKSTRRPDKKGLQRRRLNEKKYKNARKLGVGNLNCFVNWFIDTISLVNLSIFLELIIVYTKVHFGDSLMYSDDLLNE